MRCNRLTTQGRPDRLIRKKAPMDLATVDHLLTTTHSVRKRLDLTRPVEPEVIEKCIEIAFQDPSGCTSL